MHSFKKFFGGENRKDFFRRMTLLIYLTWSLNREGEGAYSIKLSWVLLSDRKGIPWYQLSMVHCG